MAKKDYYEVLGVPRTASADEVKSAYRRLARQYHPDVAKENPKVAEERFKEISEAYEVLANPDTRKRYDQQGFEAVEPNFGPGGFGWQNFTHQGDLEDLLSSNPFFQQLFGNLGGGFSSGGRRVGLSRGSDVEVTVRLPLSAAVHGAKPLVDVPRSETCPDCHGTGAKDGTAIETCPECHGSGQIRRVQNRGHTQLISIGECPRCHGTGQRILERCPTCRGSGHLNSVERIEISVPPGIEEGGVLRVPGHGLRAEREGRPGDLYVHVLFEPADHIQREGETAYGETTVPLGVVLLGGEVTVRTIDGHAALKIPAGTQPETQFRLRGNGFPRLGSSSRGDLIVTVHVEVPRSLSSHEKETLRTRAPTTGPRGVGAEGVDLPAAELVSAQEPDDVVAPDQYFTERPRSASARAEHRFLYRGELLTFVVDRGVFGSHGLDPGTSLLIENLTLSKTDRVLDLGCGWGAVGVAAARAARDGHVILTEVNRRAARLARLNLERNHAENAEVRVGDLFTPVEGERFDVIATNPPYRAGRPLILQILSEAPDHLNPGGRLLLVGKGTQGILYYQERMEKEWPGPVEVLGRRSGYRVLEARRAPVSRKP